MDNFTPDFNLKSVLNTDSFDKNMYGELRSISKAIQATEKEGVENYNAFPHLLGDTWAGLFKNSPQLGDRCPKGVEANRSLMEQVLQNPEFQGLREYTKLDELASALGSIQLSEELNRIISQNKDAQKAQNKAQEQHEKAEQAKTASEILKDAAKMANDPQKKKEILDQAKKESAKSKRAEKQAEKYSKQATQAMQEQLAGNNGQDMLTQAIAQAGAKAIGDKKEVDSFLTSMGYGNQPGEKQRVPVKDRLALAEILKSHHKVKDIANLLGRMQKIANKKQKERANESVVRNDVDLGNEISYVLPSELALLKNPVTRKDFQKRFIRGELLQYSPSGKETLGKGPIICCLDTSGSMRKRDVESKAFMLSLLMIAKKQKRAFACINYANLGECKTWLFENTKKISSTEIIELAEFFWRGGTDFITPLNEALNIIKEQKKFSKVDIVFITDGEADVAPDWADNFNKEKKKRNFSVISILIQTDRDRELKLFSDKIVKSSSFFDESVTKATFAI